VFGGFAIWNFFWHDRAPVDAPMTETIADDEKYYFSEIVASTIRGELFHRDQALKEHPAKETADAGRSSDNPYRRDVHTKSHGCVNARFEVKGDVPAQFRYGVFSAPGKPKGPNAIIRFSSGMPDIKPDKTAWSWLLRRPRDVRGMALKIFNEKGAKLLHDLDPDDKTQDFIATTSPVFFIRTVEQYSQFSLAFGRADLGPSGFMKAYFFPHWWDPRGWHLHQFSLLLQSLRPAPDSLVRETYYSGSAYRLGPTNYVKFRLRPCEPLNHAQEVQDNADYLRQELNKQVEADHGHVCFNFEVQPQVIGKNMPVEDATVEWNEKDSPFQPIATVTIDKQQKPAENDEHCENLEFNPWHTTEDFKPVGVMNRLRKVIYQEMADFRRTKNCETSCRNSGKGDEAAYQACMERCPLLRDPPEKPSATEASGSEK
jgi:hypothetical protein